MIKSDLTSMAAGIAGGIIGYVVFYLLTQIGLYGLIIPGGMLGFAAGAFAPRSFYVSVVCGCLALALGLITEWRFQPFIKDESLTYFLTHAYLLKPPTPVMIAIGAAIGFWVPFRAMEAAFT